MSSGKWQPFCLGLNVFKMSAKRQPFCTGLNQWMSETALFSFCFSTHRCATAMRGWLHTQGFLSRKFIWSCFAKCQPFCQWDKPLCYVPHPPIVLQVWGVSHPVCPRVGSILAWFQPRLSHSLIAHRLRQALSLLFGLCKRLSGASEKLWELPLVTWAHNILQLTHKCVRLVVIPYG